MKGWKILGLWRKAETALGDVRAPLCTTVGDALRNRGYEVGLDDASTCRFVEPGTSVEFTASRFGLQPWALGEGVRIRGRDVPLSQVDPAGDYDVTPVDGLETVLTLRVIPDGPRGYRVAIPAIGIPDCRIAADCPADARTALAEYVFNELDSGEDIDGRR